MSSVPKMSRDMATLKEQITKELTKDIVFIFDSLRRKFNLEIFKPLSLMLNYILYMHVYLF